MPKLSQILAAEKSQKSLAYAEITKAHKAHQKPTLFEGFFKTYAPIDEDGDPLPPEVKRVQQRFAEAFRVYRKHIGKTIDNTGTKDYTNCRARADVVVDGEVIIPQAPVPFLLYMEKQLNDLRKFVDTIPTLDPSEQWTWDEHQSLFKSQPTQNRRTKKVEKPVVLYDATEHHPAQCQMVTEDVPVGTWTTVRMSGAIPLPNQEALIERIDRLTEAVKYAREEANAIEADEQDLAGRVFGWIFDQQA